MIGLVLGVGLVVAAPQEEKVTAAEKKEFLKLLKSLPTKGEFFTDEAIDKAAPYIRVLLALDAKDLEGYDLYPFLALSGGLLERKKQRDYGVKHFATIAHSTLKPFWAVVLFDKKAASPEIVKYLQAALESEEQSRFLSEIVGPDFDKFKKRMKEYRPEKK